MNASIVRDTHQVAERRTGLLAGFGAYALWGLLPIYFKLLHDVSPTELVAHRILWSVLFLVFVIAGMRLYPALWQACRQPRLVGALALSSLLIASNWSIFMWAILGGHLVAASLGYFLNPLVTVVIGTLLLKERLRRWQLIAVLIAAVAVAILASGEWQTLWISLGLALTFAFYGLVRKLTPVPSAVGLAIETSLLAAPALVVLGWLSAHQGLAFGRDPMTTLGLIGTGAATSIPLILFAVAARSLPLVTLGLMQYVAPSLQFVTGVFLYHEKLSPERWASFMLIWAALALFIWDSLRGARAARA
ncbi:EamA family transporter RarD [Sphingobium nicotianae]|uniref:EamA family transporter RarD n=1 Tax=Sphingobium nicotianae TaxID=2782607 RepID=A0A9X1DDQ8_9SPHN|nr:EamA family transporter RarD [Sphingobium nicotianae]MBT2188032.1 EamA family transporter RarD [Sphingobium nicotianae]